MRKEAGGGRERGRRHGREVQLMEGGIRNHKHEHTKHNVILSIMYHLPTPDIPCSFNHNFYK